MHNLDKLNELLEETNLDLPFHRKVVDSSGRNLKFLRKTLIGKQDVPEDIQKLLKMKDCELFSKHT